MNKSRVVLAISLLTAASFVCAQEARKPAEPPAKKETQQPATAAGGQSSGANASSRSVFSDITPGYALVVAGSIAAAIAIANSGSSSTTSH